MATGKLTTYKSPGIDKTAAETIKAEAGQFVLRSINLLILFGIRRNCLTSGVNHCTYTYKKGDKNIRAYHCYQLHSKFYPTSFYQG
jgi:hypothetical protein